MPADHHLQLLFSTGFLPHGHCFMWEPSLLWLHGLSDGIIALAYFAISGALVYLVRHGQSRRSRSIYALFAAFIAACGTTHLIDIWTLWHPDYWLAGGVKGATAALSIVTAIVLMAMIPAARALRAPEELEAMNVELTAARDAAVASTIELERALAEARTLAGARDAAVATAEELEAARDAAVESDLLKSEFLANMSHEIRTPLNGIIGLCELIRDGTLSAEQRDLAALIGNSADSLLIIVNDILDFSKLSAGKLVFEEIDFELAPVVEAVLELLGGRTRKTGVELIFSIDPAIPKAICGDPQRLRQVLANLVGNAVKFTEHGEVVVSVNMTGTTEREVVLQFFITDTGIGISAEAQRRLFQPFHQADGSITRKYGGSGLGLAISSQLVSRMGGKIEVKSELGKGSTFSFTAHFGRPAASPRPWSNGKRLSGLRVLVVDDNHTNRQIVTRQIENWGIVSASAASGSEALAALHEHAGHSPFDAAILDLAMPGMDGLMLAQLIKIDPAIANTRLLMMSSTGGRAEVGANFAPIEAWLTKPVKQSQLYDSLAVLMATDITSADQTSPAPWPDPLREIRQRFRILVAEDNVINQVVARRQLAKLGYEAVVVGSGAEALEALATEQYPLVLMDCMMPDMDGYAAAAELRRRELDSGPHTVVVAMTANALEGDREKCLAAGMDDYIGKPVKIEELATTLDRWLLGAINARF